MDHAACRGLPVGAFFSTNGSVTLGYAMENDDRFGVWGGMSEAERRRLRRNGQRRALEAARGSGAA
jgi:hypothetical protein